jgi:hypothetical protein
MITFEPIGRDRWDENDVIVHTTATPPESSGLVHVRGAELRSARGGVLDIGRPLHSSWKLSLSLCAGHTGTSIQALRLMVAEKDVDGVFHAAPARFAQKTSHNKIIARMSSVGGHCSSPCVYTCGPFTLGTTMKKRVAYFALVVDHTTEAGIVSRDYFVAAQQPFIVWDKYARHTIYDQHELPPWQGRFRFR